MEVVPQIPDFKLMRRIGRGSYGDVWLAQSVTGIYRAIKIVDRGRFEDSRPFLREFEGIKRFQNAVGDQARQLALLHVACDEEAGVLYYVMELADDAEAGTDIDPSTYVPLTLKELFRRRKAALSVAECLTIGADLATALQGLHEAGLIHRDVKPSNIIFVNGVAKLADVGLIASSEQTLTSLGTPGYAPPEGSGSAQSDLYSLGKILYELVTGLGPDQFPRIPLSLTSGTDSSQFFELNEVILRACDRAPALRYLTALAMVDELRLLQAGRSVQELNRNRRRLRLLFRIGLMGGILGLAALSVLAAKNYIYLQRLAAKEVAYRQLAEADDQAARYTSDLHLARLALSAGDFGATRVALRRQLPQSDHPDLRNFEWFALWNETAGDSLTTGGSIGRPAISALALSPDSRFLAAQEGERPRETVIWDLVTGQRNVVAQQTYRLGGFAADGSGLTIGTVDKHVFKWELPANLRRSNQPVTGRLMQDLPDKHTLLLVEQGPMNDKLIVWDSTTQQLITEWEPEHQAHRLNLSAAALSADCQLLAASFFGAEGASRIRNLVVYDLTSRVERFHLTDIDRVQWLRFSPDGHLLALAMSNQPIRIVSAMTGETVKILAGHDGPVRMVEFSSDGQMLASIGSDRSVRVWNVESGAIVRIFLGHEADVTSLAWFSDNTRLVTGSRDGTWRIWSLAAKPAKHLVGNLWADVLGDFIFAPDGRSIAVTENSGRLAILDTNTLERVGLFADAFQPLFYEDGGHNLLALSKKNELIRCDISKNVVEPSGLKLASDQKLASVEASDTHHLVAFGFDQGALEVWDFAHGKSLPVEKTKLAHIAALTWASDRPELVAGDRNGHLAGRSFGIPLPRIKWAAQDETIYSLAYSVDGEFLAIGRADGHVILEKRTTGEVVARLEGHSAPVSGLVFSPDGSRLVSGGYDGLVIFWSTATRQPVAVWSMENSTHANSKAAIYRLKFDRSGNRLGAMTEDGQLRVWDSSH